MNLGQRINQVMNRVYDRLRHDTAFAAVRTWADADAATFDGMRDHPYLVLITFRRDGEPVPSPVWFAVDGDVLVVRTFANSGKIKRIRRDDRVVVAVSSMRGKPEGPPLRARARVLPREDWVRAEHVLAEAYGLGRKIYEGVLGEPDDNLAYLEVRPEAGARS